MSNLQQLNAELATLVTWDELQTFIAKLEAAKLSLMAVRSHRYSNTRRAYSFILLGNNPDRVAWLFDDSMTDGQRAITNLHRALYVTEGQTLPYYDITDGAAVWS